MCKLLNVGDGGMQVRRDAQTSLSSQLEEDFERHKNSIYEGDKIFFKLFQESTFEGSRAAALKMKKYAKRHSKQKRQFLLFHSLHFLVRASNSEMLSWPNSPLLVLLQFVDPNIMCGDENARPLQLGENRATPLHLLAQLAGPSNYSTHINQRILAKLLIEHEANVNAMSILCGETPLQNAYASGVVTNLDFIELLLKAGANPNFQDLRFGPTPLMKSAPDAPGAAKFLLNWPTTDANITTRSGVSFLAMVRLTIKSFFDKIALPDNPEMVQHQLLLRQWREIEDMVVERGAADTGNTEIE
jgi:hypothetical protein